MPLKLDPYTSPLYDYMHNFKLIHDYFSISNCDYQIQCVEGFDWKQEKLEEIILYICKILDIQPAKVKFFSDGVYSSDTDIQFINQMPEKFLGMFADAMQNNYFEKQINFHFLSMTNRPTWHRLSVASFLYKYYKKVSKIKFPMHEQYLHYSIGIDTAYANYYSHDEYTNQIFSFLSHIPVDNVNENWSRKEIMNIQNHFSSYSLYKSIAVEIVNETNITKGFFCTEKTVRPIAYYTPFVIMAPKNYLKHLNTLGFKTFHTVWDESYDNYEGKQRLEKIYQTINQIANMTIDKLHKQTFDICVYNKSVLDSYQWKNKFKDIKL